MKQNASANCSQRNRILNTIKNSFLTKLLWQLDSVSMVYQMAFVFGDERMDTQKIDDTGFLTGRGG